MRGGHFSQTNPNRPVRMPRSCWRNEPNNLIWNNNNDLRHRQIRRSSNAGNCVHHLAKRTQRGKIEHAEWDECEASGQAMMLPISGKPEIGAVRRRVSVRGLRLRLIRRTYPARDQVPLRVWHKAHWRGKRRTRAPPPRRGRPPSRARGSRAHERAWAGSAA